MYFHCELTKNEDMHLCCPSERRRIIKDKQVRILIEHCPFELLQMIRIEGKYRIKIQNIMYNTTTTAAAATQNGTHKVIRFKCIIFCFWTQFPFVLFYFHIKLPTLHNRGPFLFFHLNVLNRVCWHFLRGGIHTWALPVRRVDAADDHGFTNVGARIICCFGAAAAAVLFKLCALFHFRADAPQSIVLAGTAKLGLVRFLEMHHLRRVLGYDISRHGGHNQEQGAQNCNVHFAGITSTDLSNGAIEEGVPIWNKHSTRLINGVGRCFER